MLVVRLQGENTEHYFHNSVSLQVANHISVMTTSKIVASIYFSAI